MTVVGCDFGASNNKVFDPQDPNGHYILDLAIPYDRAIACQLVNIAYDEDGEQFQNETFNGKPFELPEESGGPWVIPSTGILELDFVLGSIFKMPTKDDLVSRATSFTPHITP